MFCKYCGFDIGDKIICPNCNQQSTFDVLLQGATEYSPQNQIMDEPNIFLIILAFFIPLFGFIYYPTHIAKSKIKSRAYGIASLCGVIGTMLVGTISLIIAMV